ncbi:protein nef1, partial [Nannochloropsis gaditana CCMP526]|uniref:protein nef1 n=1 Tax=Nannochloropsis gaditana (strain CCMP526) TaxID=1093141 RepID=UPI00029F7D40
MSSQTPYYSPVNPAAFGTLALILIGSGLSFMALFFVYEMKGNPEEPSRLASSARLPSLVSHDHKSRSLVKELFMATLSSLLLGCGTLFLKEMLFFVRSQRAIGR